MRQTHICRRPWTTQYYPCTCSFRLLLIHKYNSELNLLVDGTRSVPNVRNGHVRVNQIRSKLYAKLV